MYWHGSSCPGSKLFTTEAEEREREAEADRRRKEREREREGRRSLQGQDQREREEKETLPRKSEDIKHGENNPRDLRRGKHPERETGKGETKKGKSLREEKRGKNNDENFKGTKKIMQSGKRKRFVLEDFEFVSGSDKFILFLFLFPLCLFSPVFKIFSLKRRDDPSFSPHFSFVSL